MYFVCVDVCISVFVILNEYMNIYRHSMCIRTDDCRGGELSVACLSLYINVLQIHRRGALCGLKIRHRFDPCLTRPVSDLSQTWVRHKSDTCQTCVRPVWTFSSYSIWQSVGYFVWTSAHGSTGIICYHSTRKCFITNCKGRVGCILFGETAANILNTSVV